MKLRASTLSLCLALVSGLSGLDAMLGTADSRELRFVAAGFKTSRPGPVAWIDERTVIFSVGGVVTLARVDCPVNPPSCNNQLSIQLWDVIDNRVSLFRDRVFLHCYSQGRVAYSTDSRYYSGPFRGEVGDTGFALGDVLNWTDCVPSAPERRVEESGITRVLPAPVKEFYPYKNAYLMKTRRTSDEPMTLIWEGRDGKRGTEMLRDGPWNRGSRTWERYYPSKAGVVVVDGPASYLVTGKSWQTFFPGFVVSRVATSPSGCQVSFFGETLSRGSKVSEAKLYAVKLC